MSRATYHTHNNHTLTPFQTPNQHDLDHWSYRHTNGLDTLAKEMIEYIPSGPVPTGVLDQYGNMILKSIEPNAIGFHAIIYED